MDDSELNLLLAEAEADADADARQPDEDKIEFISRLMTKQMKLEDEVEECEEALSKKKKDLEDIKVRKLPLAMIEANCKSHETSDGSKLTLKRTYLASVVKAEEPKFFNWLEDHGFEGILDTNIEIAFGKGGRPEAKEVLKKLQEELELDTAQLSENIHWSTLRAFAREQTEAKAELYEGLKVFPLDQAEIKRPKKK